MTQTTGRFFDELGKLITDAAGAIRKFQCNELIRIRRGET